MIRLVVFDLDGTLAESKAPLSADTAECLRMLSNQARVAIISGGSWTQFEKQLLPFLAEGTNLENLSLLPTCGTRFYQHGQGQAEGGWSAVYADDLPAGDRDLIVAALKRALAASGFAAAHVWGDVIEDRGGQITLSALGQEAPLGEKLSWDPDLRKRKAIQRLVRADLPRFSIQIGGSTSIDVTKPGVDKAYGIGKLASILAIETREMIYVGDALFEGGNDFPATTTGAACLPVSNIAETRRIIQTLCACLGRAAAPTP